MELTDLIAQQPTPLISTDPNFYSFEQLIGQAFVLYFYPKDDTPGCTQQAKDFKMQLADFAQHQIQVLGVSCDPLAKHQKFKDKYDLPFILISDESQQLCQLFAVIQSKTLFGQSMLGIERSTFLFNQQGQLVNTWRKVKVKDHVASVLSAAQAL
jgi:peroxiredoxin Q/BCP